VEGALREKLAPVFGKKAVDLLEEEFSVCFSDAVKQTLTDTLGTEVARSQFRDIIEFMSGRRPGTDISKKVKCMILTYEGEGAVKKIREVLGPTDPLKAPGGTVRRDFGSNVMVNTAHASDSIDSANREKKIVKIRENKVREIIEEYLAGKKKTP
jgi:nucleoside diphosphate kinase